MNAISILKSLEEHEGCVEHMYQCTGGRVTIGLGHALESGEEAARLPCRTIDGVPASREQVLQEFAAVAAADPDRTAAFYRPLTNLRLSRADIEDLARRDIDEFASRLRQRLPAFDGLPEPAQEALFDMAYNLGIEGLLKKFPKMMAAVRRRDWEAASRECRRGGISETRNAWTADRFREAGA